MILKLYKNVLLRDVLWALINWTHLEKIFSNTINETRYII